MTADTVIDGELSTQGWNRYTYVHNNPIRYKDPTGHAAIWIHKDWTKEALSSNEFKFSKDAIKVINNEQAKIDKGAFDPEQQHRHNMRRDLLTPTVKNINGKLYYGDERKTESIEDARKAVANQMKGDLDNAVNYTKKGDYTNALKSLAGVYHNVQDKMHNLASLKEHGSIKENQTSQYNRNDLFPTKQQSIEGVNDTKALTNYFFKRLEEDGLSKKQIQEVRKGFQNYKKSKELK